jgi:hypothetical protein
MPDPQRVPHPSMPPPAATLLQMVTGGWVAQALYVVAKLGIADLLRDGQQASAALAQATHTDAQALYRVLRALARVGIFVEDAAGRFGVTPLGACLQTGVPGSLRAYTLALGAEKYRAWGEFLYSVHTGQPAFAQVFGMGTFAYYAQHPEAAAVFNQAMTEWTAQASQALLAAYDFARYTCVVDVGGGHGQLLTALLQAYPRLRGILVELPAVAAGAAHQLAAAGLTGRCDVLAGDMFAGVPRGGDLYILKNVLTSFDEAHTLRVLRHCHEAMTGQSTLLVVDPVILPGPAPAFGPWLDLHLLVTVGGRVRTAAEYQQLLEAASFRLIQIIPTHSVMGEHILEGVRADHGERAGLPWSQAR